MSDIYYTDKYGNTIFRAEYYKNKGRCCKSSCLHCPYGHTLRTQGLTLKKINEENSAASQDIFNFHNKKDDAVQGLLDSAFGANKKVFNIENSFAVYLKGYICAIAICANGELGEYYLHKEFMDQGIDKNHIKELIETLDPQI